MVSNMMVVLVASSGNLYDIGISIFRDSPQLAGWYYNNTNRCITLGLIMGSVLIMFGMWMKIGVNVNNFRFTLPTVFFHLGLAGKEEGVHYCCEHSTQKGNL